MDSTYIRLPSVAGPRLRVPHKLPCVLNVLEIPEEHLMGRTHPVIQKKRKELLSSICHLSYCYARISQMTQRYIMLLPIGIFFMERDLLIISQEQRHLQTCPYQYFIFRYPHRHWVSLRFYSSYCSLSGKFLLDLESFSTSGCSADSLFLSVAVDISMLLAWGFKSRTPYLHIGNSSTFIMDAFFDLTSHLYRTN